MTDTVHTNATSVWKFPADLSGPIEMPVGAEVLRYGFQDGMAMIWARVDPKGPTEKRIFQVFGTGHSVPPHAIYITTFDNGPFVWHVFELVTDDEVSNG